MATKIIVSYDGTDNDRDALALGSLLAARARRSSSPTSATRTRPRVAVSGSPSRRPRRFSRRAQHARDADIAAPCRPQRLDAGWAARARGRRARRRDRVRLRVPDAQGHVDPQASARRLLDGGPVALASRRPGSPSARFRGRAGSRAIGEDGDPCTLETAEGIASDLGGKVTLRPNGNVDLVVVGSKPGTVTGRVTISAAAEYLIELSRCPVVVLPRGVAVRFGSACRLGRDVPTESRRFQRRIGARDRWFLGLLLRAAAVRRRRHSF